MHTIDLDVQTASPYLAAIADLTGEASASATIGGQRRLFHNADGIRIDGAEHDGLVFVLTRHTDAAALDVFNAGGELLSAVRLGPHAIDAIHISIARDDALSIIRAVLAYCYGR